MHLSHVKTNVFSSCVVINDIEGHDKFNQIENDYIFHNFIIYPNIIRATLQSQ